MRNGTFIIPSTGERSRRQFTLRTSSGLSPNSPSVPTASFPDTTRERIQHGVDIAKHNAQSIWQWLQSDDGHGVLKCTFAYLLGSIATFWSPLSDFLGHRDGKHIVATLTVYFHPARTAGSMIEAALIAMVAVLYANVVCMLSMAVSIASRKKFGSAVPAHFLVLVVFIGGGLGFIGWVKQRLNQPLVNVAATLASIAIISVVTKEESVQDGYFSGEKVVQMVKMLLVGISFSTAVNLLVWQVSARVVLRKAVVKASVALSDRLAFITKGFLNGSEDEVTSPEYAEASKQYSVAYGTMTKTLREAKLEHYFFGHERIYALDKRLVKSIDAVQQAIGGLRSALNTQFTLLREGVSSDSQAAEERLAAQQGQLSPMTKVRQGSFIQAELQPLPVIEEVAGESRAGSIVESPSEPAPLFRAPSDIFAMFMQLLGPSMKSLAYTLSELLRTSPFGTDVQTQILETDQLRASLQEALGLYNEARRNALEELYRNIEMGRTRSEAIQADIEEVAAACGHFSFSLQAVAEEMDVYLDAVEDLKHWTEAHKRSWTWLMFWKRWSDKRRQSETAIDDVECDNLVERRSTGIRRSALPRGIPRSMIQRRDTFSWDASPQAMSFKRSMSQIVLSIMRFFSREDVLFGVKVGIGAILWGMFAFIPDTRPVYQAWRGEWGLLSYMIVVGMTTGASNTTGTARFIGTIVGGTLSCVSWTLSGGNAYALALFGWFMALGNFYLILVVRNAPLGRISLLTYNVIVLYAYSLSQSVDDDDDDEGGRTPLIFDITYHRMVSVTLGIVWGILVCRLLWPISGRTKFREGLAVLYLQLGLIWKRGPLTVLMQTNNTFDYLQEGEQAALQRYGKPSLSSLIILLLTVISTAFKLETLRESAASEFELRGPFPSEAYGRIMHSTKHILDGFYAMRLLTQRRISLSAGERHLFEATAAERLLLCERISHVFQVLASCLMLEYPLTDAIPTIEGNKDRLLGKIYKFRQTHMADGHEEQDQQEEQATVVAEESDYALLYAYILVTAQVAAELKLVRTEIEGLYGVLNTHDLLLE